jgi:phage gp29-like protein
MRRSKAKAPANQTPAEVPAPTLSDAILARQAVGEPSLVHQFTVAGGNLSPRMISSILTMADIGRISRFVDLMHEFRQKDGHLHSCLQASELGIGALPWDIQPPDNASRKERKACQLVKEALQANPDFRNAIEHFAGEGPLFGHATTQTLFEKSGGALLPLKFKTISCRRFGWRMSDARLLFDPRGILEADANIADAVDLMVQYPEGKFLQYRPRINGDVPVREGLARFLVWLAVGRNWIYKDWLELAELAWKPKRLGKYAKGASSEDKLNLINMLEQVMAGGVGIFADTTEPQLLWPQGGSAGGRTSNHKELQVWIAGEMSKGILGSTDIVEPSENGSKSAVEVRNELRVDIRNARAEGIGAAFQPLLNATTRLNYGDGVRPGRLVLITKDPADLGKFSVAMKTFKDSGLRVPVTHVYDEAGMPQPKPGDICLGDKVDENGKLVVEEPNEPDETKEPTEGDEPKDEPKDGE